MSGTVQVKPARRSTAKRQATAPSPAAPQPARRVLMISCVFPPTGGPGSQRSAKFAKYLPRHGWQPIVWSADGLDQLPHDETLAADLPDTLVQASRPAWSYVAEHRRIIRGLRRVGLERVLGEVRFQAVDWRILRFLRWFSSALVPDDHLPWALRSVVPMTSLARRAGIDAIYSTYSPASNHLLAMWLHWITGLPWVADFRDLWTEDYRYPRHGRFRRIADRHIEQAILERADAVVGVTESQARVLARRVRRQSRKFACITNGVDTDSFDPLDRLRARDELHGPQDRFALTFTGWFLADRVHPGLVEGMARFAEWMEAEEQPFVFRVVGAISDALRSQFAALGTPVEATGYLPHDRAIEHMVAADVLLALVPMSRNGHTLLPGKVFEYLAAGRPILLVGPRGGEADRLVGSLRAGVGVEPEAGAVYAALTRLWREWKSGRLASACTRSQLEPFSRSHLAGQLATVLNGVCRRVPRKRAQH